MDLVLEAEGGFEVSLLMGVPRPGWVSLLRPRRGPLRICRRLYLLACHTPPAGWNHSRSLLLLRVLGSAPEEVTRYCCSHSSHRRWTVGSVCCDGIIGDAWTRGSYWFQWQYCGAAIAWEGTSSEPRWRRLCQSVWMSFAAGRFAAGCYLMHASGIETNNKRLQDAVNRRR